MLVALLGLAAALYAVTWLIAGPPGSWNAFASTPTALVSPMVAGNVREVQQIGLRAGGHGRLAVSDVANSEEPRHDRRPG
jgi:hypothetical protein